MAQSEHNTGASSKIRADRGEGVKENAPHGQSAEAFLEAMPDGFAAVGPDYRFTYVNAQAERLWRMRRQDVIGHTPAELFGGSRLNLEFRKAMGAGDTVEFELFESSSQQWILYKMNSAPAAGLSVYFEDITTRKLAEAAAARLASIVDSSDDAIISKTLDGTITSWNKSAERLFGYTAEEAVGQSIMILIPPDRVDEEPKIIERLRRGERVDHFETVRRRKDGSLLDISLTISPLKDSTGMVIGASKIARDITERKRVDDELRRANKDLEQFVFSASHDLQEPLRTIKIYAELLATRHAGIVEGEAAKFLGYLQHAATRMEALVRDLLTYAQLSRIDQPVEAEDAAAALADTLSTLSAALSASGGNVTFGPLPTLPIHGVHLRLLFQNLIGNAIKYRNPDVPPAVHVSAARQGDLWVFSVRDNGIGIKPEYKEKIFDLFTRLHSGEQYAGTGIGLAICQRIVERYHGRIWVESRPGEGSVFSFAVPA
jgi:PAS domain S-box-containing protein